MIKTPDGFVHVRSAHQEPDELAHRRYRFTSTRALRREAIEVAKLIAWARARDREVPEQLKTFWESLLEGSIGRACGIKRANRSSKPRWAPGAPPSSAPLPPESLQGANREDDTDLSGRAHQV